MVDDNNIVDLFFARDEEAIRLSAEKYGSRLRSVSFRIVGNMLTAEECENDTYWEAWKRIPPHEPRTYLQAFLTRIVRSFSINRCVSDHRLKREGYVSEFTEEMEQCIASPMATDAPLMEEALMDVINSFLEKQPKQKRVVFVRRYFYLEKTAEIAENLGLKEGNVRTILTRMRKDLHSTLEKEAFL